MHFLIPASFALAAFIPLIIAMYLLRLRRTEQVVSSVYLWRRMVRDMEANAPWQRLRRNLLLLLQLLFLTALILALARPFAWTEGVGGRAVILILDTSASMAATDVAPNRLGAARAQAQALVDGLPEDSRVTLITAGAETRVVVAGSQDRRRVRRALAALRPEPASGDLTQALNLAAALAAHQPDAEIVLLSDGGGLPDQARLPVPVRYLPVGQGSDNQAISALALQTSGAGQGVSAFVQVTNYGPAQATRRLALYADGQLVNAFDLTLAPGAQEGLVVEDLPAGLEVLEARLLGEDILALDDRAWAVRRSSPVVATLVTPGNLFLETALALFPNLEVTIVKPEDWEAGRRESHGISLPTSHPSNLTILDACVPPTTTLPTGSILFVAPVRSTGWFSVTGKVEAPVLRAVDPEDPLLRYVNLREFSVLEAARVPLPEWARPVIVGDTATGESWPLLFAGRVDGRRMAVLTFDLHRSDLPLTVSFPLLLSNLVNYLASGTAGGLPDAVAPGEALSLPVPPGVQVVVVQAPDGTTTRLVAMGGQAIFADTVSLGAYRVTWLGAASAQSEAEGTSLAEAAFAVNLFSPAESALAPREEIALAGEERGPAERGPAQARQEWWRPLAWVALVLFLIEWLVYQWGTAVRVVTWIRGLLRREVAWR